MMWELYNIDCIEYMSNMPKKSVDFLLTDIPYGEVSEHDKEGIRVLTKGGADIPTFELKPFLDQVVRITRKGCVIFCGITQISEIYTYLNSVEGGSRVLVWEKNNPSPLNAQNMYLSASEFAVWHKFKGGTFNAFYKSNVLRFPQGSSKLHPTMKNVELFKDIIRDNTNENDIVFDPCSGSGTTGVACMALNRRFIGCELDEGYYKIARNRMSIGAQAELF